MDIYVENKNDLIHETSVDFVLRSVSREVHVVQYDNLLPIIKVNLFNDDERFEIPNVARINVRLSKIDHTYVYKEITKCNPERNAIYFDVDFQMTVIDSKITFVIELVLGSTVACSSPVSLIIDRNPIQQGDVESHSSFPILYDLFELEHQVRQNTEDISEIMKSGMEPNVIESISIHNKKLPVDDLKNVNIDPIDEAEALSILMYGDD